ncbi:MAG TPA: M67 family metallopeptidase [Thermoplasmata archaeon]|nr:M67 family metallopeptidase [Thermoplasmata archaeon]
MQRVELGFDTAERIRRSAEGAYPEECCGFLIGTVGRDSQPTIIDRTVAAPNRAEGNRGRRYAIEPEVLADLEERLEPEGRTVLGFYHSHPDLGAGPSSHDVELAWPGYLYAIVAVDNGRAGEIAAYSMNGAEREFRRLLVVTASRPREADPTPPQGEGLTEGRP